jgi:hypothetical protein
VAQEHEAPHEDSTIARPKSGRWTPLIVFLVGFLSGIAVIAYSSWWLMMIAGFGIGDSGCLWKDSRFVSNYYLLGNFILIVGIPMLILALLRIPRGGWARTKLSLISGCILCIGGLGLIKYMHASSGCRYILEDTYLPTAGVASGFVIMALTVWFASRLSRKPS